MVLAATFATWYWTFHKKDVPYFTLTVGLRRTLRWIKSILILSYWDFQPLISFHRYHLGTVAFGSLVLTICRVIRFILEYIDDKLKRWDNTITRCILCCMKCFFWCLEQFLRFLNKNAYIMCAIYGKPFCASARDAFNLLLRNCLRVITLNSITKILFFVTKCLITIGMGAVAYTYLSSDEFEGKLKNVEILIAIMMLGTYLIASIFFRVYSMAVDTLFMCFCMYHFCIIHISWVYSSLQNGYSLSLLFSGRLWTKRRLRREALLHVKEADENSQQKIKIRS